MEYQLIKSNLPQNNFQYTVAEVILTNRGIKLEDVNHYLNTTDTDILDPKLLDNLKNGAKMLINHIKNEDMIYLVVDPDVDGYTSAALLVNYLNNFFPTFVQNNIYYKFHEGKQHGIENKFIEEIVNNNYKLVICPDSSSNDYEIHEILAKNGIDVLVIDHHEAEKVSEYACVINNQLSDYPTKSLSGVGVVFKFCSFLDELMNTNYAENFYDLVALGCISDVMDLRDFETRHLITKGLKNVKNPFFKKMREVQDFSIMKDRGLHPHSVGFYIGPQINASIRMGTMENKVLLFESMLDFKAYNKIPSTKRGCKGKYETVVEQACRNCTNIKNKQAKARDESVEAIEKIIVEKDLLKNKIVAVKLENNQNKNLTGLIAMQLMNKYQHPFLILNKVISPEGVITWEGSGRSFDSEDFSNFKTFLQDSGYVFMAEGHQSALGVGITDECFPKFIEYSNEVLKDCSFNINHKVDFVWEANDFKDKDVTKIAEMYKYYGKGIEEPEVVVKNINLTADNFILQSTRFGYNMEILLPNGVKLIKIGVSEEEYNSLLPKSKFGSTVINIVGLCTINDWGGTIKPQIKIEDYELVRGIDLYF